MGLDMYLEAEVTIHTSIYGSDTEKELNETLRGLATTLGLPADNAGKGNYGSVVTTLAVHAGYWRKANAIHAWFVRECQDGVDECQRTKVELAKLRELREICRQVLTASVTEWGKVRTGTVLTEDVASPVEQASRTEDASSQIVTAITHDETGWSIWTGEHLEGGEPTYTEGAFITNPEKANELLPTESGFFFGSTSYDSWYLEDLGHTIDVIDACEKTAAFGAEKHLDVAFYYHSSW